MGPIEPASINDYRSVITFIDGYTENSIVKLKKFNFEAFEKFKEYVAEKRTPSKLRSDNPKEYKSQHFAQFCVHNKIKREFRVPETRQQNGVAERFNRVLPEMTRCNLLEGKFPKTFLG